LPRALAEALGKQKYFAESLTADSRQRWRRKWAVCGGWGFAEVLFVPRVEFSAKLALPRANLCRAPDIWLSAKR
jgi:hypothetical protein